MTGFDLSKLSVDGSLFDSLISSDDGTSEAAGPGTVNVIGGRNGVVGGRNANRQQAQPAGGQFVPSNQVFVPVDPGMNADYDSV